MIDVDIRFPEDKLLNIVGGIEGASRKAKAEIAAYLRNNPGADGAARRIAIGQITRKHMEAAKKPEIRAGTTRAKRALRRAVRR